MIFVHADERKTEKATLGQYLKSIREDRGLKLRQVEEASNKEVSNAYLSQIETGKIEKPSLNVLHILASLYAIDYEDLMERAGYITRTRKAGERHGRLATFAEHKLTPDEEVELMDYLRFIRQRRRRRDKT